MRWDVGVGYECCGYGCEGDEELGTEVRAQTGDEAGGCCKGDFLFDVEVEAVELVYGDGGV